MKDVCAVLRLQNIVAKVPQEILLTKEKTSFGREKNVDVQFDCPSYPAMISRRHAEITRQIDSHSKLTYTLQDLNSLNGIFVNNKKVYSALLSDGDMIAFGGGGNATVNEVLVPNTDLIYLFIAPQSASTTTPQITNLTEKEKPVEKEKKEKPEEKEKKEKQEKETAEKPVEKEKKEKPVEKEKKEKPAEKEKKEKPVEKEKKEKPAEKEEKEKKEKKEKQEKETAEKKKEKETAEKQEKEKKEKQEKETAEKEEKEKKEKKEKEKQGKEKELVSVMEGATEKEVKVKDKEKGSKEKKRKREVSTKKSSQKKRSKRINLSEVEHQNNKTDKVKDSGPLKVEHQNSKTDKVKDSGPSKVEHQNTKIDKVKDSEPSKVGHENSKTDKKDEDSDLAIMVNPPSRKSRRLQTKQPKELKDRFELTGIFIRPPLGGGKKKGIVKNTGSGIHYNTNSADVLIPFKSIEHMILCPNEGGTITLLHIYLKEPITYPGRVKTTQHIQFYNESNKQKDSRKMKMAFKEFISSIKEKEFHIETTSSKPIQGMPQKSMLKLEITPECLVSLLLDQGFFIILLKNVLVAYFERAEVSKSFDLVFILQDFSIQPIHSIPSPDLESLQRWLRIASVPFYQGSHSLDWTKIITNITNIKEKGEFKKGDWNTLFGGEESQDQQQSILDSEEETESGEWKPNMSLEDKDDFSIPKADAAL